MSNRNIRKPAVAGSFYPADPEVIKKNLETYIGAAPENKKALGALGAVSPHAGWFYSGHVAGALFASIKIPDTVVVIGPNHHRLGSEAAIDSSAAWRFPFGDIEVDQELSAEIAKGIPGIAFDASAHASEHSLEVIIPFLHYRNSSVRIVPISLSTYDSALLTLLGVGLAGILKGKDALIVASSDLSHFETDETARSIDAETIKCIEKMEPEAVLRRAVREQALCGGGPLHTLLTAGKSIGAVEAKLVKYATSGDISGDRGRVVGYAGFIVS
jgi:hypothetical protein